MTLHDKLMLVLMAEYLVLAIVAIWCGQHGKAVYWCGAIILSVGILLQK